MYNSDVKSKIFKSKTGDLKLPVFFPDATYGFIRTLDTTDIINTKTEGILVNTYHLYRELGSRIFRKFKGVRGFMKWEGAVISDSGGFQVMSLAKRAKGSGKVTQEGVTFKTDGGREILLTPEKSIEFQMRLGGDMVVVLDDFTPPGIDKKEAELTVRRTIDWAKRSKEEFLKECERFRLSEEERPYLLGVVQGGDYADLRESCIKELVEIGFDGLGFGGWPIDSAGNFDYKTAELIAELSPEDYLLYGLGVGKPDEVVNLVRMGYDIFDCVLPTRDARHKRLYVYNAHSIGEIDLNTPDFYGYYVPDRQKYYYDKSPVSGACDCLLCKNYSKAYLAHLFRSGELSALRLASIHNLRFYSILMEKLKKG